jgi:dTDP-4-amino-4,6-dideoxygalactose transaminase
MPVAPFGASIDVSAWDAFAKETGIPVVIDAAAGFDSAAGSENPLVLSLHATKVMGIGEGGAVLCTDEAMAENIRAGRNFGFLENRSAKLAGTNAKLSEYGAAVGLAALDCWKETRLSTHAVVQCYLDIFSECMGITFGPCFSAEIANSTCNVLLETPVADRVIYQLKSDGIEARKWWNNGCHKEPVFKKCAREPLPMTEFLTERVVGLPFFRGLSSGEVFNIRDSIEYAIKG